MRVRINKAHFPVTVLGYGRRIGVWFQGCPIRCNGCVSQDTWEDDPEKEMPLSMLLQWCFEVSGGNLDGITITGGEPFHQPEALEAFLKGVRTWEETLASRLDILCYSGFELDHLEHHFPHLLDLVDTVVAGPFIDDLSGTHVLYGSNNQRLRIITELGCQRYGIEKGHPRRFQVSSDQHGLWFVGIPKGGDMARVVRKCKENGLEMQETSWEK